MAISLAGRLRYGIGGQLWLGAVSGELADAAFVAALFELVLALVDARPALSQISYAYAPGALGPSPKLMDFHLL